MLPQRPTGQAGRAFRVSSLPLLICLLFLHTGLLAQAPDGTETATKALDASVAVKLAAAPEPADAPVGKPEGGANPAPELDTWLLVGTGAVVLLLLYTRRRARVLTPQAAAETRA